MMAPLIVLACGAMAVGWFGGTFADLYQVEYTAHVGVVGLVGTGLGIAGIVLSYLIFGRKSLPAASFGFVAPIARLAKSGIMDRFYELLFYKVMMLLAAFIGWLDRYVIDGLINLIGYGALESGRRARTMQTGNARDYVFAVVAGVIVLCMWGLFG